MREGITAIILAIILAIIIGCVMISWTSRAVYKCTEAVLGMPQTPKEAWDEGRTPNTSDPSPEQIRKYLKGIDSTYLASHPELHGVLPNMR